VGHMPEETRTSALQGAFAELQTAVDALVVVASTSPDRHWVSDLQTRLAPCVAAVDQLRRLLDAEGDDPVGHGKVDPGTPPPTNHVKVSFPLVGN